jgi:iron(III) transport system substrate-binding protein
MRNFAKRKALIFALVLFLTVPLASLGFSAEPDPSLVQAAKKEGQVVVYSQWHRNVVDTLAKDFEKKYGIHVEWTRKNTGGIVQLVEAEVRSGQIRCDVAGVGNPSIAINWARRGLFQKFVPNGMKEIIPEFRPKGELAGLVVPRFVNVQSLSYNTKFVKKEEAPKSWKDVVNPKWKGKICFPDPRKSAPGAMVIDVLRILYGWGFVEKFAKMDLFIVGGGPAVYQTVLLGEAPIGAATNAHSVFQLMKKGEPIDQVFLKDGSPGSLQFAGVMKGAPHAAAGKLWLEHVISYESQKMVAEKYFYYPVNSRVPKIFDKYKIKYVDADHSWLLDHATEQANKFMALVKKAK